MAPSIDPVARARSLGSAHDAVTHYREWAHRYDRDVFETAGFTGSARIADLLAEHLPARETPILDLGCGTGAVAVRLRHHGFTVIDGIDISPEMLAVARTKRVYRELRVGDLTRPFVRPFPQYGASVSAGTFTTGHVGADAVRELVSVLADRAVVAWVVALALWPSFEPALHDAHLTVAHRSIEAIRRGGPAEGVMVVARVDRPAVR